MNRKNRNIAEWAFYALIGGLLAYAASRTLDFVQSTLAADKQILGYLYLLATGVGAVIWLYVYLTYAEGSKQRGIAFIMGIADLIGEMVLVYADTVRVASANGQMQMTAQEQGIFISASVGIIGLNILAGYAFKLFDPNAEAEAHARDMADEVRDAAVKKMNTPAEKQRMANELAPILEAAMFEQVSQEIRTAAGQYGHAPIDNTVFDRRKPAMWVCLVCDEFNLIHNSQCIKCGAERGTKKDVPSYHPQPQDYTGIASELYHPKTQFIEEKKEAGTKLNPFQPE
jgi:hypothetical protein